MGGRSVTIKDDVRRPNVAVTTDVTADDSDKAIAVPAGKSWTLKSVRVKLTSTVTGGNRQIAVEIRDGAGVVLWRTLAGAVQAASVTRFYSFAPGLQNDAAFVVDEIGAAMPADLEMPETFDVHVLDVNAVDAAADDMEVAISAIERG